MLDESTSAGPPTQGAGLAITAGWGGKNRSKKEECKYAFGF
jgi:hypothetical protein